MAGQMTVTAYVDATGPLADGRAEAAIEKFTKDAEHAIAEEGRSMLAAFKMDRSGRARGGFAANLRVVSRSGATAVPGPMVRGVTWAPWLEGTSKRNQSTGFRGYHLFRKVRAELDRKATEIAERRLQDYLPQIGGE